MSLLRTVSRVLYFGSRTASDVRAIQNGRYGKRLARRAVNRRIGRVENRIFR